MESPEVFFFELAKHVAVGGEKKVYIDSVFIAACELGSLRLVSVMSEEMSCGWIGGKVDGNCVVLTRVLGKNEVLNLLVAGVRAGFGGMRFSESDEITATRNRMRWV